MATTCLLPPSIFSEPPIIALPNVSSGLRKAVHILLALPFCQALGCSIPNPSHNGQWRASEAQGGFSVGRRKSTPEGYVSTTNKSNRMIPRKLVQVKKSVLGFCGIESRRNKISSVASFITQSARDESIYRLLSGIRDSALSNHQFQLQWIP